MRITLEIFMAKIIILSCKGGGGHTSAAQAIQEALPEHATETIDFLGDTLAPIDFFYWISWGAYTGQDFYNFLLKRNSKRLINMLYYIGLMMVWLQTKSIECLLDQLVHKKKT